MLAARNSTRASYQQYQRPIDLGWRVHARQQRYLKSSVFWSLKNMHQSANQFSTEIYLPIHVLSIDRKIQRYGDLAIRSHCTKDDRFLYAKRWSFHVDLLYRWRQLSLQPNRHEQLLRRQRQLVSTRFPVDHVRPNPVVDKFVEILFVRLQRYYRYDQTTPRVNSWCPDLMPEYIYYPSGSSPWLISDFYFIYQL